MINNNARITRKGYIVDKNTLTEQEIEKIKKELTMMPKTFGILLGGVKKFYSFRESGTKLFLPIKYGIQKLGEVLPAKNRLPDGKDVNYDCWIELRDYQKNAYAECQRVLRENNGGILSVPCAWGKCLGGEVNVMMYDGTIKNVKKVEVGDLLMGDDSTPRRVVSLARGREEMFRITPKKGMSYTCNRSHILSLKCPTGSILDISIDDYLKLPKYYSASLRGFRVPINFPKKEIKLDPYLLGYRLGNGSIHGGIPHDYKCNSREVRLKLLAGFIDADGHLNCNGKNETLEDDIIFVARSLGFAAYKNRFMISGKGTDEIPVLIKRKKAILRKMNKDVLNVGIKVESIGEGNYYGFEVAGNNRRFLLEDFTVTHNTIAIIKTMAESGKKGIVVLDRLNIVDQWWKEITKWTNARVGIIQGKTVDVKDKDIVLAMVQSISMKDYPPEIFAEFGIAIYDEVHCMAAETFSRVFPKICAKRNIGLSATVERSDGLSKVFKNHIGDIFHHEEFSVKNKKTIINMIQYKIDDPNGLTKHIINTYTKKANTSRMITNMANNKLRTLMIVKYIRLIAANPKRQILVLSDRKDHLRKMNAYLTKKGVSCGLYIGNMSQSHLELTCQKQVILGIYNLCQKAFNLKKLNTLLYATPRREIQQIEGRILRQQHAINPIILDFVDYWSPTFKNQWYSRQQYYKAHGYCTHRQEVTSRENIKNLPQLKYKYVTEVESLQNIIYDYMMQNDELFGYMAIYQARQMVNA